MTATAKCSATATACAIIRNAATATLAGSPLTACGGDPTPGEASTAASRCRRAASPCSERWRTRRWPGRCWAPASSCSSWPGSPASSSGGRRWAGAAGGSPRARRGSQMLLHITVPQRLLSKRAGETDAVSYVLGIEGRPYTVHLQQQFFLSDDFRIYTYGEQGSLRSDSPHIKGGCHYRGYIDGFPSSAVTLSTCSGLRGLLQFENVSYGIEPLDYSPAFEHFVYRVSDEETAGSLFANSHRERGPGGLTAEEVSNKARGDDELAPKNQREVALHVVLERALYIHLGADNYVVTRKIVQVSSLLSDMFRSLNLAVTLSSVEVWMDNNTFKTTGNGEEVLGRLLKWKQTSPTLQPHEVPYLLLYRDQAAFVGAVAPGKACQRNAAGAVAVYQGAVTLESFSVLLAQLLGRSLGISYDSSRACRCPASTCVMSPEALRLSGAKAFSSCSIGDFETFLKQNRDCPFIRPSLHHPFYRPSVCGNGVVEPGEQCDCRAAEACALDKCCTTQCNFKPGMKCSLGLCCENCQFKPETSRCRPTADAQCDLAEFCTGASASCPPDLYVQDGHGCEHGTGYCYKGRCQSPDLQCRRLYGRGAKNAPLACYEEVNSQQDRFGHCGNHPKDGYQPCSWPNLGCGKLVCTYPNRIPFTKVKGAVIYAQVQEHLCVSFDFMRGATALDPLLVKEGTKCGPGKVCLNGTCHPHSVLEYDCNVQKKCHGHGVCDNKKNCHCDPGWNPPKCKTRGFPVGRGIDSALGPDRIAKSSAPAVLKTWLPLSFGIVLLALVCGTVAIIKWSRLKRFCARRGSQTDGPAAEEGSDGRDTEPEPGTEPEPEPGPRRGR
ncbi:disintegrin and metalloproteinase domain-containing protein 32-like [Theristicus caerulescens]